MMFKAFMLVVVAAAILAYPAMYMMATGDFPGSDMFYGIDEDHAVVDWMLTTRGHMLMR